MLKQMVFRETPYDVDITGTISDARKALDEMEEYCVSNGFDMETVEITWEQGKWDDDYSYRLVHKEPETDDEYEKRVNKDAYYAKKKEERDLAEFERLKEKFKDA